MDANGRWHRPDGQFASNSEVGLQPPSPTSTSGVHGNSLNYEGTNYGYKLVDRNTGEVLKYGESIHPSTRYSIAQLDEWNADMVILREGSKSDIHIWQHEMNEIYKQFSVTNKYPL